MAFRRDHPIKSARGVQGIAFAAVMIAALALRLYGLNWDRGYYLHPDELHVADVTVSRISLDWPPVWSNLLNPEESHYNPRANDPNTGRPTNYAYGALPIIVTSAAAKMLVQFDDRPWDGFEKIYEVGRFLSALMDTLTVGLVFLIARRVISDRAALLAALIYALTPIGIQLSHFFTTDAWVSTFVALTLYCAVRAGESDRLRWFGLSGFAFGLALATKGSVVPLGLPIAVTGLWTVVQRFKLDDEWGQGLIHLIERGALSLITAFIGFALFEPYAIARPRVYLDQLQEQSRIVRGTLDVPYTRQYVGTLPFLYQADQLLKWGAGPVAGLLMLAGVVYLIVRCARLRSLGLLVLLVWLAVQGLVVGLPQTKFLRYLAPLIPVLAIGAGGVLDAGISWLQRRRWPRLAPAFAAAALAGIALWTASFTNVYAHENPRLAASSWMYANIPAGSHLTAESWDLSMPVALMPGLTPDDAQYSIVSLDMYGDRDPNIVADYLYEQLQTADYVVLASNRVVVGVNQLPWRYPVQIRYYDLLNTGGLGFHRVADFRSDPGIGSVRINDQNADESFLNYDQPEVLIYKKSTLVDRPTYDALMATAVETPASPTRSAPQKSLMLDQSDESLPVVSDARWSSALTDNSLVALLVWITLLILLQAIGAPIAALLFDRFGELGWGLARLTTLLLAGYLVWIAASVKFIAFEAVWCWIAIALLAAGSFVLARRTAFSARLRRRRRTAMGAEIAFWVVFAFFLLLRFANPDSWHPIWGGEKPMEFAHLNAILRSVHFPPYDPWFSGGFINYYYYGTYLIAFCIKLTGIPSEIAFNLAQPTTIALLASAAYSVAATVGKGRGDRAGSRLAGWLGVVLLLAIGNLSTLVRIAHIGVAKISPDFSWTWNPSRAIAGGITEFPYFTALYADLHAHVIAWPITILVIAVCYSLAADPRLVVAAGTDSAFKWSARTLLGARLLFMAIALGSLAATNAWDVAVYGALFAVSVFMATRLLHWFVLRIAMTVGLVGVTGAVAYGLFLPFFTHYAALFGSVARVKSHTSIGDFTTHAGIFLGIIGLGAVVAVVQRDRVRLPYVVRDPAIGMLAIAGVLLLALVSKSIGSISVSTAGVIAVAVVSVAFALLIGPGLLAPEPLSHRLACAAPLAGILAGLILAFLDRPTLGLAFTFASLGVFFWLTADRLELRFTGALIAAGSFVAAGVDIVFLVDDLAGDPIYYRMNTVFKFYNQVWTLLALSSAVMLAGMVRAAFHRSEPVIEPENPSPIGPAAVAEDGEIDLEPVGTPPDNGWSIRGWGIAGSIVGVVLILCGLLYPLLATLPRLDQRFDGHPNFNTLNALDWMSYGTLTGEGVEPGQTIAFADDLKTIDWFNKHVDGSPVIAEASFQPYRGNSSRFSIATGLPDVIGWAHHETQQRYPNGINERVQDVRTLYDSTDVNDKLAILRKYDVRYVIVGDIERYTVYGGEPYASPEGIAAFDQMVGKTLQVAFQSGTTTVYRVTATP